MPGTMQLNSMLSCRFHVHLWLLLPFCLVFVPLARSSPPGAESQKRDTLAEVGTRVISTEDLLNRIEFMPWLGKNSPLQVDSSKIKALQSLVAEQLLALQASAAGIGEDTLTRIGRKALEKLLVRDELHRREVRSRVTITEDEIRMGLKKYATIREVLLARVRTRREAQALAQILSKNANPESTLTFNRHLPVYRVDTLSLTLGSADAAIEDTAFSLHPARRSSFPVFSQYVGWAVVILRDEQSNPEYTKRPISERPMVVERKLRQRKETFLTAKYIAAALKGKKAEANPVLFEALASRTLDRFVSDPEHHRTKEGFALQSADVDSLTVAFWPERSEVFIEIENGGIPLGDVIEAFRSEDLVFPSLDNREFRIRLNTLVKAIVAGELMAREGFRRNLQHTEEVRHDLGLWTNYWLARLLEQRIVQSITVPDEEILAYLIANANSFGSSFEVNVREVLYGSLDQALHAMERIATGTDMARLAREESKREAWRERGGVSGMFRVSAYPQLGFVALAQDTGRLAGPVHLKEGYSVFTVLDKRHALNDSVPGFVSLRGAVRLALLRVKRDQLLAHAIASMAKTYGVTTNYGKLANVNVSPVTMVTRRFLGFGGVITAVPLLPPRWEWVKDWEKIRKEVP